MLKKMSSLNLPKGKFGENLAADFLKRKGYTIIARNFKARYEEIDLITIHRNTLVFVEVKTRWSTEYGTPEEAVTPWKIRKLIKAAEYYALLNPKLPEALQIDVVAVQLDQNGKITSIEHLENVTG